MKIALCLFKYFPYGGLQRDFIRIASLLSTQHTVEIFTTQWNAEKLPFLPVHTIAATGLTNHGCMQKFAKNAIKQAKKLGCTLTVSFNKLPGVDIYFAADDCYALQANETHSLFYRLTPRYFVYKKLEKKVFQKQQATKILALTEQQKANYQKIYHTPDEHFYILPPDFSAATPARLLSEQERQKIRQSYNIFPHEYFVLMVCSAFKTKGVDRALKAFKKLPHSLFNKTHLLIIGNDAQAPYLRLAKKLQIDTRVQFIGAKNNVSDYMQAADLFLHPAYKEAAGKVLLEAMLCGLPVLTTACCGYAKHIEKGNAGIVLPETFSDEELAKVLAMMLTTDQKDSWKQQALDYSANYSQANLAEQATNFINKIIAQHHA